MDVTRTVNREILKAAVQKIMFCQVSQEVLDVRNAVLIEAHRGETLATRLIVTGDLYDSVVRKNVEESTGSLADVTLSIYDGRELFS
jgi:hypothetical protein